MTGNVIKGLYGGGGGSHHGARITLKSGATMDLDDYLAMRSRDNMRSLNADQMTDCGGRGCSSEGKLPKKDRSATKPHNTKPKSNRAKNDLCGRCHK